MHMTTDRARIGLPHPVPHPACSAVCRRHSSAGGLLLLLPLLLALLGTLAGTGGCAAGAGINAASTPPPIDNDPDARLIRFVTRHDLPLANSYVNDRHVGFFLIDTGSSITVVERSVAARLGLEGVASGRITGIGGTERVQMADIDNLQVDNYRVGGHRVAIVDLDGLRRSARWPIAGILGINTLKQQPFTIDYAARRVTVHDAETFEPPDGATRHRLHEVNRLPAIKADVGGDDRHRSIWLLIDSGMNSHLALPYHFVRPDSWMLSGERNVHREAVGVGGAARNISSELALLRAFDREWRDVPVHVELDAPEQEVDGLAIGRIGNGLLKQMRITFDYESDSVWIELVEEGAGAAAGPLPSRSAAAIIAGNVYN